MAEPRRRARARLARECRRSTSRRWTSSGRARSSSSSSAGRRSASTTAPASCCAVEDRCSHDDGPLCEGEWDEETCRVICPRHGATFDLRTGRALTLPATEPVGTYPVTVEDGIVTLDLPLERTERVRCFGWGDPLYTAYHDEEWGRPVARRAQRLRAALPRGLPVRPVVADDPAQARGLPARVRRLRPRRGRRVHGGRHRAPARRRLDRAAPRQDRGDDHERARDAGAARRPARRCTSCSGCTRPPPGRRRDRTPTGSSTTPESEELAKVLRRAGFRFIGPTTVHAAMQACGVVNDHLVNCVGARRGRSCKEFVRPLVSVLTHRVRFGYSRKGGGPALETSSTGSGGTSS